MAVKIPLLIVVPTLDSFSLLPRLVESLLDQKWFYWRVLFVDGPSGPQHRGWLDGLTAQDSRFGWIEQSSSCKGIFGAMNQGFAAASSDEWLLFWGSDDWAARSNVLGDAMSVIEATSPCPDLIVCRGRYVDAVSGVLTRPTFFQPAGCLTSPTYRRALFSGATPPHQATLIGPGARGFLSRYDPAFRLSADLDYFLQLSSHPGLRAQCLDLELVHMAEGGVSGQQTQRRLQEVHRAYRRAFGWGWWFPFVARYIRRLASLAGY